MAYVDGNREKYESDDVVSRGSDLQPCEQHLFSRYIRPGMAILDMGVGGGRTTPYLAKAAGRYVGADYSGGMVEACRRRFPDQDMAVFDDEEFDAVVFSFNGIDYIRTAARGAYRRRHVS